MDGELGFHLWLEYGQIRGWVSEVICETHDCLPLRDREEAALEDGEDPCVPALRVWGPEEPAEISAAAPPRRVEGAPSGQLGQLAG